MSDKSAEELARKAHASADNYALFPSATSKAMAHRDMDAALAAARREAYRACAARVREMKGKVKVPASIQTSVDLILPPILDEIAESLEALADKPAKEADNE